VSREELPDRLVRGDLARRQVGPAGIPEDGTALPVAGRDEMVIGYYRPSVEGVR
jgi:hypothetical protein